MTGQSFSGTDRVGADIIRPPTLQIFEQNRIGRTGVSMLQNIPRFDIVPPNYIC